MHVYMYICVYIVVSGMYRGVMCVHVCDCVYTVHIIYNQLTPPTSTPTPTSTYIGVSTLIAISTPSSHHPTHPLWEPPKRMPHS